VQLRGVYNFDEINTTRQPAKEEPTIRDWVEQPGAWDPADILRGHKMFRQAKYIDLDVYWAETTFFSHLPTANDCQSRQNPLESAWRVL